MTWPRSHGESNNLPTLTRAAEPRTGPLPLSPPHVSSVVSCKTPVIGFRAHLGNLEYHPKVLHLIASAKTLFPKKVTFTGSGDLDVGMTLGESPFTPLWGRHSQHISQAPGQGHKHGEKRVSLMAVLHAASSIKCEPKENSRHREEKSHKESLSLQPYLGMCQACSPGPGWRHTHSSKTPLLAEPQAGWGISAPHSGRSLPRNIFYP